MRVEHAYPGEALRHLRDADGCLRVKQVIYRSTGELVEPGDYCCTFCGHVLWLRRETLLPLCSACDGAEYIEGGRLGALDRAA